MLKGVFAPPPLPPNPHKRCSAVVPKYEHYAGTPPGASPLDPHCSAPSTDQQARPRTQGHTSVGWMWEHVLGSEKHSCYWCKGGERVPEDPLQSDVGFVRGWRAH